jgi:hypothetical protein
MWRRAALVRTDDWEKIIAYLIKVTRIIELETMLSVTSNYRYLVTASVTLCPTILLSLKL